jgi:hypothetical protein
LAVDDLLAEFVGAKPIKRAKENPRLQSDFDLSDHYIRLRDAAQALMCWHADELYLTKDGAPKPLPARGSTSLTSLASKVAANAQGTARLVNDLIDLGFVAKSGALFLPAMRSAVINGPSALILAHATAAILRLIGTVEHNVSGRSPPRYERHVADVRIRASDLPVFLRFVEEQGQYLIDSVDDWLSKREIKGRPSAREVTVGLGAFAWVDPPQLKRLRVTQRSRAIVPRK